MKIDEIHTQDKYYWLEFKGTYGFLGDPITMRTHGLVTEGDSLLDLFTNQVKLAKHFKTGVTYISVLWQNTEDPNNAGSYNAPI